MTSFPSDSKVYHDNSNGFMTVVFYGGWATYAPGLGTKDANRQALEWVWGAIEKRTDLWAEITKLEVALAAWRESLDDDI